VIIFQSIYYNREVAEAELNGLDGIFTIDVSGQ